MLVRQRVAVEVIRPIGQGEGEGDDGAAVLASGWLRHGETPEAALARVLVLAGLAEDGVEAVVGDLRVAAVTSSMIDLSPAHGSGTGWTVRLHRIGLRFPVPGLEPALPRSIGDELAGQLADPAELLDQGAGDHRLTSMYAGHVDGPDPVGPDASGTVEDRPRAAARIQRLGCYAIVRDAGRVLLTRLRRTGLWALPGGGVDHGEHPDAALRREVFEESGLELTGVRLVGLGTARWTGRAPTGTLEDFHAVHLLYTGGAPAGQVPQVVEVDGSTDRVDWVAEADVVGLRLTPSATSGLTLTGILPG